MNNKKISFPVLHLLAIATNKTIMTDFDKLKSELAILYPDFTDIELKQLADNLTRFYTIAAKTVLSTDNLDTSMSLCPE